MDRLQLLPQLLPQRLHHLLRLLLKLSTSATWGHATTRAALAQCRKQSVMLSVESRQAQHLAQPARETTCVTQANAMRSQAMESWTSRHARALAESRTLVSWYEEISWSKFMEASAMSDLAAVSHTSVFATRFCTIPMQNF